MDEPEMSKGERDAIHCVFALAALSILAGIVLCVYYENSTWLLLCWPVLFLL